MTSHRFLTATFLAVAVWMLCGAYTTRFIYRGWIPHDEGTIGQSAERVLSGELPHRDFDEVYTGGLTYLHAAGMKILGVTLRAPRQIAFVFFMAFLAAVYAIGRRVSSAPAALVAMATTTVWSMPNYFVSLPSWYNLFFATFGVLAFLNYLQTDRRRWLVVAGACGGFSVLAKISGVFFLAGGVLFLTFVEQNDALRKARTGPNAFPARAFFMVAAASCLVVVISLMASASIDPALIPLFAPAVLVGLLIPWGEWIGVNDSLTNRVSRLWLLYWPFIAGAAVPLLALVLFYWQEHAVADLVRGVLILPQRRLGEASWNPPTISTWGLAAPYALLLIAGRRRSIRNDTILALIVAAALGTTLLFAGLPLIHSTVSTVARSMTMMAAVAGALLTVSRGPEVEPRVPTSRRPALFLLITMAAMVALVQFPYATPTYFFYAAPMTILAVVAVIFSRPQPPVRVHLGVAAFFFVFAIVFTNRSYAGDRDVTAGFAPYEASARLDLERGGLWVPAKDKQVYERVVRLLKAHASGGTIYAGPDCPEIYFLSGFPNPSHAVFDFLTVASQDASWMTSVLARANVRAVVINTDSRFSPPLDPAVVALLEERFPSSERVGRFVVRFK